MLIETREDRLLVLSDMHVGNPFSTARQSLRGFFDYARRGRFNVCINGDGFEILQAKFSNLAHDSVEVLNCVRSHIDAGLKVYYVVGNHDIALEQFLRRWWGIAIVPFLNVDTGAQRVRVEHGHLYDPSFMRNPALYEGLTKLAGVILRFCPDIYRVWAVWENYWQRMRAWRKKSLFERNVYYAAAHMLLCRGFDVVIFGHTHNPEDVELVQGRRYINSGNWVRGGSFVEISDGNIELMHWNDGRPTLAFPNSPRLGSRPKEDLT
jgi:UDP-2,3-diacylglucosamine pyrophosphatase LpxH